MAMLRVSSYRKLFEEENWSQNGGLSMQCAGLYRASVRGVVVDKCGCDTIDFEAARSLNKEGMNQFVQDRTTIAALNDRLVRLIELARCFEMENESLECQIVELEEKLNNQQASSSITTAVAKHGYNLAAVVERLRKEKGEIVDETVELHKELEYLKDEYEKAAQQRIFLQQERQDIAEEVDAVTAECLALREQVSIYEEQLDNMEAQDMTAVGRLREPAERMTRAMAAIKFGSPDIAAALDVKEYYCQLAESLQNKCWAATSAVLHSGAAKKLKVRGAAGSRVKDLSKIKNISEIKMLISELQKELGELQKCNMELVDEIEMKKAAYMDEISELECAIDEIRQQEADLQAQMKEQCEDYKVLLTEKMARDMEIAAYRSLVEKEDERLCNL
ncbi:non-neuronal cytoplasmic intermediate filament protein [Channa argus]|uniref:non-neuronal cytoplasmic intermediate filament protein n=1 Tax=Channa argus TaxID=215402 RepID=UPI003520D93D